VNLRHHRKTLWLSLGAFLLLAIGLVGPWRPQGGDVGPWALFNPSSSRSSELPPLIIPPAPTLDPVLSPPLEPDAAPDAAPDEAAIEADDGRGGVSAPPVMIPAPVLSSPVYFSGYARIAFVDVRTLALEMLPSDASPEERADFTKEVLLITSQIATARNLDLVLDSSGDTLNRVPLVLYRRDTLDLTPAVREEMQRSP
jgi:hypothetical protein